MNRSDAGRAARGGREQAGFTLLEVMVSVAILALAVVPLLLTRERCYDMAYATRVSGTLQELAQLQLAHIALNVLRGEGSGGFEGTPGFSYKYSVTIYDFSSGLEEDEDDRDRDWRETGRLDTANVPDDAVFRDEDLDEVGPLMARHVVLTIFAPDEGEDRAEEYVIDTYIPLLMTEEQYERTEKGESP